MAVQRRVGVGRRPSGDQRRTQVRERGRVRRDQLVQHVRHDLAVGPGRHLVGVAAPLGRHHEELAGDALVAPARRCGTSPRRPSAGPRPASSTAVPSPGRSWPGSRRPGTGIRPCRPPRGPGGWRSAGSVPGRSGPARRSVSDASWGPAARLRGRCCAAVLGLRVVAGVVHRGQHPGGHPDDHQRHGDPDPAAPPAATGCHGSAVRAVGPDPPAGAVRSRPAENRCRAGRRRRQVARRQGPAPGGPAPRVGADRRRRPGPRPRG